MKKKLKNLVLVTGGFDPIHTGHISYLNEAKKRSKTLVVGINSDKWLLDKKNYFFMPLVERKEIIENFEIVDKTITFDDSDGSAINAIEKCKDLAEKVIFANGGDRKKDNIPELKHFENDKNVEFIYGIGGNKKKNSSSNITENFILRFQNKSFQITPWGSYVTLNKGNGYKIKLLKINKGGKLSLQFHNRRSEQWIILNGEALIELEGKKYKLTKENHIKIPKKAVHRIENIGSEELIILESNFGSYIEEDDIVRLDDIYNRVI